MLNGLLLVDKEPRGTSHDVVQSARRILGQRKIGHCGTLDPAATGLLVLTLGKATRLTRFLINAPKTYSGAIKFGVTTDTYDATGEVLDERQPKFSEDELRTAMAAMVGSIDQAAPAYSAKKVQGVKYYELARRGEEVPKAIKRIKIYSFDALAPLESDRLEFSLGCSTGTYVRSVAHDLGQELGCGAHLEALRRLKVGPFSVDDAATVERIRELYQEGDPTSLGSSWVPFDAIPLPFRQVTTDAKQERRIVHGQTVLIRDSECEEGDWVKLLNQRSQLIAVGSVVETIGEGGVGVVRPRIVFQ